MRIEQIKYLLHIAESGSITRSAESLNISQQGLSHSVRQLERELDAKLLYREGNRTKLTALGKRLRDDMESMVQSYEEILSTISANAITPSGKKQRCQIHTTPHFCISAMQSIFRRTGKLYPNLLINVVESNIKDLLREGAFDKDELFILTCPERLLSSITNRPGVIEFRELYSCYVTAVVSNNHPLADNPYVSVDDLCRYPLMLYGSDIEMLRIVAKDRLDETTIRLHTSNFELYRSFLGTDNTIALSIPLAYDLVNAPNLRHIPLENAEKIIYGYIVNNYAQSSQINQEILNLLEHDLNKLTM